VNQINRLGGGLVRRDAPLSFTVDGKAYHGFAGDTLASALLGNGVRLMGRSFKYHRPRGVFASGSEEPNALFELRSGARKEPNTRATTIELFEGLSASSQNLWPSLAFDALALNDLVSPFLTAGFYYKTFMWPKSFWEKLYEPLIRRAAGLGSISAVADPDNYDKGFIHCDVLVIGAGPAGLMAALTAGRAGADVLLCDEDFLLGGRLNAETFALDDAPASAWLVKVQDELRVLPNVRIMTRTTVFSAYDHGVYGAVERVADHLPTPGRDAARQIVWRVYARRALLCAGATERAIPFRDNDRPGIMLAGAMRAFANRWAVCASRTVAIFTNNDDGHRTARDLVAKGVSVSAVIDSRPDAPALEGSELLRGATVVGSRGRLGLKAVTVRLADGRSREIACGALGVSGGWNPNVHLTCHQRGRPVWNEAIAAFVPGKDLPAGMAVAGSAAGHLSTHAALQSGSRAAAAALEQLGMSAGMADLPRAEDAEPRVNALWQVPGKGRAWLDLQNDVTVKDIELAHRENFRSVEHLKRYTTLGMATDQGKTSNVLGLAVMAELTGRSIEDTGTTIYRPPYSPIALAALAGRAVGQSFRPRRLTASHRWAERNGAVFVEAGQWMRAQYFPRQGETHWRQTVDREVLAVRRSVGICDVSTLGKIDVQGTDAAEFLNRIYCNGFATLAVGRTRYGLMLREDGFAQDDGTAARLGEHHFVVTTTTANAALIYRNMEFYRQCIWPDLDVQIISTTDAWSQYSVAGPNARRLLAKIVDEGHDISNEAFPFMACGELRICGGLNARLFRISFSGELAYEIAVPTRYGEALLEEMLRQGEEFDAIIYGTEALGVLRIEKGHPAGNELNGQTTAAHLGMGRMVSKKKDCIGSVMSEREGLNRPDDLRLVGLKPLKSGDMIVGGAHLLDRGAAATMPNDLGWVTSVAYSPHLRSSIGLAFLKKGSDRIGDVVRVVNPLGGTDFEAEVTSPHFVDPEGVRLRA
jgi:sarcosine oxidase subunit alpha